MLLQKWDFRLQEKGHKYFYLFCLNQPCHFSLFSMVQNMPIVAAMICCIGKILFILSLLYKQYSVCLMTPRKLENLKSAPFSSTIIAFYTYFLLYFTHHTHCFYCRNTITIKLSNVHLVKNFIIFKVSDLLFHERSRRVARYTSVNHM